MFALAQIQTTGRVVVWHLMTIPTFFFFSLVGCISEIDTKEDCMRPFAPTALADWLRFRFCVFVCLPMIK